MCWRVKKKRRRSTWVFLNWEGRSKEGQSKKAKEARKLAMKERAYLL
jgi:hypothetical protein